MRKWDKPEYRRIRSASVKGDQLIVQFEDGTSALISIHSLVPPGSRHVSTDIAVEPYEIRLDSAPKDIEIPWSRIRALTDPEFKSFLARAEADTGPKIGRSIRQLRRARHLSSKEVAERSGITAQSLSRIENGRHDVVFTTLQRILKAMGCTLRDLAQAEAAMAVHRSIPPTKVGKLEKFKTRMRRGG